MRPKNSIVLIVFVLLGISLLYAQASSSQRAAANRLEKWRKAQIGKLMNDWGELERYRLANETVRSASDPERVVFFGDSITDGWPLGKYFPDKHYINRGISGQTTPQMLVRFRQDVISLNPKVVVILAGVNDIAGNTGPMELADIESNYASMTELAKAHNIRVVLSSVLPVHNYSAASNDFFPLRAPGQILKLNRWLESYCAENYCVYLDYFTEMVDQRGWLKEQLSDDGLHPNAAGYAVMAPMAASAIERATQKQ